MVKWCLQDEDIFLISYQNIKKGPQIEHILKSNATAAAPIYNNDCNDNETNGDKNTISNCSDGIIFIYNFGLRFIQKPHDTDLITASLWLPCYIMILRIPTTVVLWIYCIIINGYVGL